MRAHGLVASLILAGCISNPAFGQSSHTNPCAPVEVGPLPPVASLTEGIWLKGDLHVHSRHGHDSSSNSEAKITAFSDSVGMDYLCITDHDNNVQGDIAHNARVVPQFKSNSLLLLYDAGRTTTRGHGNVFSAHPYDHQRLYDVRDQRDVVIGVVKKELGIHLSAKARNSQAVVDTVMNGRVSVSANSYAPRVELYADLDRDGKMDMMMGDNVKATGKPVKFTVQPFSTLQATGGKTTMVEFTNTPVTLSRDDPDAKWQKLSRPCLRIKRAELHCRICNIERPSTYSRVADS